MFKKSCIFLFLASVLPLFCGMTARPQDGSAPFSEIKFLQPFAGRGDEKAQLELALAYGNERGVQQNSSEAAGWFRKSAEQALAQMPASIVYGKGGGIGSGAGQGAGPYVAGNGVVPPVATNQPLPSYTDEARKARVSGMALLQCIVRKDGTVDSFKVIRGLGYGLDESAINTIATKWRFKPGTKDGAPVDVMTNIEVRFMLPDLETGGEPSAWIPPNPPAAGETVLFANFEPNTPPSRPRGGWLLGKSDPGRTTLAMVGLLIRPQNTSFLGRVEIVVRKFAGGNKLTGYLMSDKNGPDIVIETIPFEISPMASQKPSTISGVSSQHPVLESNKRYWFVLSVPDVNNDSFFWFRQADQPRTEVALCPSTGGVLRVQAGTLGSMLRVFANSSNPAP